MLASDREPPGGLLLLLSVTALHAAVGSCSPVPVTMTAVGAHDSGKRLLIATQQTEFKEAIVSRVVDALSGRAVYIEVVDISRLSHDACRSYDAVVVINDYRFGRMHKATRALLRQLRDHERKKVFLLTTASKPSTVDGVPGVDAISSASSSAETAATAERIIAGVSAILPP